MATKVTKRNVLDALATVNFANDITVGDIIVTPEDIKAYIDTSLAQIDNRNAKAAERQAQKKQAGDELRSQIKAVLGETPKSIAEIMDEVDVEDLTPAKVVARLTQLVKLGEVFKSDVKVDGKTMKVYSTVEPETED